MFRSSFRRRVHKGKSLEWPQSAGVVPNPWLTNGFAGTTLNLPLNVQRVYGNYLELHERLSGSKDRLQITTILDNLDELSLLLRVEMIQSRSTYNDTISAFLVRLESLLRQAYQHERISRFRQVLGRYHQILEYPPPRFFIALPFTEDDHDLRANCPISETTHFHLYFLCECVRAHRHVPNGR